VISGHWVHWSSSHLAWDLGAFVLLGVWCEGRGRARFAACLAAAAVTIPVGLWWLCPELSHYGGLSGLDSALFVLLVCELLVEALRERSYFSLAVSGLLLLGFAGKIAFEVVSGDALFATDLGADVVPVPWAHLVGAAVGLACLGLSRCGGPAHVWPERGVVPSSLFRSSSRRGRSQQGAECRPDSLRQWEQCGRSHG